MTPRWVSFVPVVLVALLLVSFLVWPGWGATAVSIAGVVAVVYAAIGSVELIYRSGNVSTE